MAGGIIPLRRATSSRYDGRLRQESALHEAPAVVMADGYSQRTGRAALVNLHTAAGMGNVLGKIDSAWCNRAPLIITARQQIREMLLLEPYLTCSAARDRAAFREMSL